MILKRKSAGGKPQATILFETESTYLIRDNFEDVYNEENELDENNIKYDEYQIQKTDFDLIKQKALNNTNPENEIEETVFNILRNYFSK